MKQKLSQKWLCAILATMIALPIVAGPIQASQTSPSVYQKQMQETKEKQMPFMLDNFKVIQQTLENLGVTPQQLEQAIKEGKKLEEVLMQYKISTSKFKRMAIKEYYKAVNEGLEKGQLTKEQATQLKQAIKATVKQWFCKK